MSLKIDPMKIDPPSAELCALFDLQERIRRDFEAVMFGGYPPGYDRRTGMPGTLRLGGDRCPHCGPVIACARHMATT